MPKAPARRSGRSKGSRASPTRANVANDSVKEDDSDREPKKHYNKDDPKASHLYTDDNPSTTLQGTGFKDAETAKKTVELVSKRSITYQFQTINTMYYRAKNHPHKNEEIETAITVFRNWLEKTYPEAKEMRKDFKPLLSKKAVSKYLDRIKKVKVDSSFAEMYVDLPPRKRLANVLVDNEHPEEPDWERTRELKLTDLIKDKGEAPKDDDIWEGKEPTVWHLHCIAWAWSPVSEKKL